MTVEKTLKEKLRNAIGHIGFGLLVMVPVGLVSAPWLGWFAQSLYWLGRERGDMEIQTGMDRHKDWWRGWNVLKWPEDPRRDLLAPVVVNGILAVVWTVAGGWNG